MEKVVLQENCSFGSSQVSHHIENLLEVFFVLFFSLSICRMEKKKVTKSSFVILLETTNLLRNVRSLRRNGRETVLNSWWTREKMLNVSKHSKINKFCSVLCVWMEVNVCRCIYFTVIYTIFYNILYACIFFLVNASSSYSFTIIRTCLHMMVYSTFTSALLLTSMFSLQIAIPKMSD